MPVSINTFVTLSKRLYPKKQFYTLVLPLSVKGLILGCATETLSFARRRNSNEMRAAKRSDVSVSSSKRNAAAAANTAADQPRQNRNDQATSSSLLIAANNDGSSSSIWARLLLSTSKLSGLDTSSASLRAANDNHTVQVGDGLD